MSSLIRAALEASPLQATVSMESAALLTLDVSVFDTVTEMPEEQAMAAIAEVVELRATIAEATELESNILQVLDLGKGASGELLASAVNALLKDVPELQIEVPAMESVEDHVEVAMEGISDVLEKIASVIAGTAAKLKAKMAKAMDAFKNVFRNQHEKAQALLVQLETAELTPGKYATGKDARYFQAAGKPLAVVTGMQTWSKELRYSSTKEIFDAVYAAIDKTKVTDFESAMDMTHSATQTLLAKANLSKAEASRIIKKTQPGVNVYARKADIPGGFTPLVYTKEYSPAGSKKAWEYATAVYGLLESGKLVARAKVEKVDTVDIGALKQILEIILEESKYAVSSIDKAVSSMAELEGEIDSLIIEKVGDIEWPAEEYRKIASTIFTVTSAAMLIAQENFTFQMNYFEAMLRFARKHL